MGFFSSIWGAIKSIFSSVMTAIAKVFGKVFGSPIVASLAMFVVAFCIVLMSGGTLAAFLANPINFIGSYPILMAAVANVILTTLQVIFPEFSGFIGKVMGVVSFVLLAMGVMSWYDGTGFFSSDVWFQNVIGSWGVSTANVTYWFTFASSLSWFSFITGASDRSSSVYVNAWVDGFLTIPGKVVEIADVALSSATSSIGNLLTWAGLGFLGYKLVTRPSVQPRSVMRSISGKPEAEA